MKKNSIKLKLLTAITSLAMVTSMTPAVAFAANDADTGAGSDASVVEIETIADEDEDADTSGGADATGASGEEGEVGASDADEVDVDATEQGTYVMLNIPYSKFYQAEIGNDTVDVFTSATKNKAKTKSMAYGTYHTQTDSNASVIIEGVSFPVKVDDISVLSKYQKITDDDVYEVTVTNRGQTSTTKYEGKDALFGIGGNYAYYVLDEAPSFYKELTVNEVNGSFSFSEVKGDVTTIKNVESEFTTDSSYGDYQLNLDDDVITQYFEHEDDAIYAATVNTTDGSKYGLRALENIWLGSQLAWCSTDNITAVHNCPTSYVHYSSLMGKTVKSVTYYTSKGIYEFELDSETFVPTTLKTKVTVENAALADGQTTVSFSEDLPRDFDAEYTIEGFEGVAVSDGVLTFTKGKAGSRTLVVSDKNGKYASLKTTFTVTKKDKVAKYNSKDMAPALVACKGIDEETFEGYISGITSVSVDDTAYSAAGRGATTIINKDGSVNLAATSNNKAVFGEAGDYEITVSSTGYRNVTFTIEVFDEETYMAAELPGNVTGAKASASYDSVSLTWSAAEGAESYNVYRTDSKDGTPELVGNVEETSYKDTNTTIGTTYYYSIKAVKEYSNKLDSNTQKIESKDAATVSAKSTLATPKAKAKAASKSATISWGKIAGADGYEVYRSTKKSSGFTKVTTISKASTVKYTNKKLKKGKTYYYKVRAYKTVNGKKVYSSYSSVVSAKAK